MTNALPATTGELPFPTLDHFLGSSAADFFAETWQKDVHVFPRAAAENRLASISFDFRDVVEKALKGGKLEVLGGKGRPGPTPGEPGWPTVPNAASARVSRAEDWAEALASACRRLTEEVSHRVNANLYVSPPQSRGLDRHQDGHDVLVLQVEGRKRWRIWKSDGPPPLDPFPALPFEGARRFRRDYRGTPYGGRGVGDAEIEGKGALDLDLGPGDLIYVPRGWAHEVWTEDFHSAHLTFGFHLVSWLDLLMTVAMQASRRQMELRDGLPIGFARVGPDVAMVRARTRSILASLQEMDGAEAMEELIGRWMCRDLEAPPQASPPATPLATPLDEDLLLRRCGPAAFVARPDSVGLFRPSHGAAGLWLPTAFAKALQFVATVEPGEFRLRDVPGVSASSRARLCGLLVSQGYVEPVTGGQTEVGV